MTFLDVRFHYGAAPRQQDLRALDRVREVYGIRGIWFDEQAHQIRVEYDASRLTADIVAKLLRNAGIDLRDRLPMVA
jgi:hypothetical protein